MGLITEKRPFEDTVRGQPSTSQEESSQTETNLDNTLILDFQSPEISDVKATQFVVFCCGSPNKLRQGQRRGHQMQYQTQTAK